MTNLVSQQFKKSIAPVLQESTINRMDAFGSLSKNTKRAYLQDASLFVYWLLNKELVKSDDGQIIHYDEREIAEHLTTIEISPTLVIMWLQQFGFSYKISTVLRKISSISWVLKKLNLPVVTASNDVKETLKLLKNLHNGFILHSVDIQEIKKNGFIPPCLDVDPCSFEEKKANPFRLNHLKTVLDYLNEKGNSNRVYRDKALVSLLWHGLFRREEFSKIRIEKISFLAEGMIIRLATKTGMKERVIPYSNNPIYCPVRLTKDWLKCRGNPSKGWLFVAISRMDNIKKDSSKSLNGQSVEHIFLKNIKNSGIEGEFSGHSPRSGGATEIYSLTGDSFAVKNAGGWQSDAYMGYIRQDKAEQFKNAGICGIT